MYSYLWSGLTILWLSWPFQKSLWWICEKQTIYELSYSHSEGEGVVVQQVRDRNEAQVGGGGFKRVSNNEETWLEIH